MNPKRAFKRKEVINEMLVNIEAERARNQMTQEGLSERLGITPKTYRGWVNEETDIPSSALIKLAKLFKTDIDYLLEGDAMSRITA